MQLYVPLLAFMFGMHKSAPCSMPCSVQSRNTSVLSRSLGVRFFCARTLWPASTDNEVLQAG